jgi:quercetin dioxygenase-like cupin family protein
MAIRRSVGKNKKSNRPTAAATVTSGSHGRPSPSRTRVVRVPARTGNDSANVWKARPDRPVAVPLLHLRLADELGRLRQESTWRTSGRNAITLTKEPTLRLVLLLLGKGTTMPEHQTAGPLTLQVLSGLVAFRAGDRAKEVGPGELIVLESAIGHEIEALEESAVLLTLARAS